jgi:hypothetical protein
VAAQGEVPTASSSPRVAAAAGGAAYVAVPVAAVQAASAMALAVAAALRARPGTVQDWTAAPSVARVVAVLQAEDDA